MNDAIRPAASPEFRLWLSLIVGQYTRRALTEERRQYWSRFFSSWVADDPDPQYSQLDLANGLEDGNSLRNTDGETSVMP